MGVGGRRGIDCRCPKAESPQAMATVLQIDAALLAAAQKAGGFKTKRETVNQALADFVRRRRQVRIRELFGKIDLHPGFDPKKLRGKR